MSAFLIRRLLRFVVVCFGVSLVTFSILHASGDPIALIMPEAPEADRVQLRVALGLSDPLPTQFVRFVTLRQLVLPPRASISPRRGADADDPGTDVPGRRAGHRGRAARRHLQRGAPQHGRRPRGHGGRVPRSVDARVLDRHHAHAALRGAVAPLARLGLGHVVVDGAAGGHARSVHDAALHADHSLEHARGHQPRLRADCPRQGRLGVAGDLSSRAPQRGAADRHRDRSAVRAPAQRRGADRNGVRRPGRRAPDRRGDPAA